ncbi:MAG: cytochrome c3 family protein [Coriobacteriia bacterium]|nr:cytochrome c3 family protein [Coriobacteriia bacterium]
MSDNEEVSQEITDDQEPVEAAEAADAAAAEDSPTESETEDKPKKKKRGVGFKILIVVIIVIVVLGAGGGGAYLAFHPNPKFCNFICHTPMDGYVASYLEGTSINAIQADVDGPLGVTVHRDGNPQTVCIDCHQDGLSAQLTEGMSWISGNYQFPLAGFKLTYKQPKEGSHDRNGIDFCLRPECHEGIATIEDLKASSADEHRNPHDNHNGNLDCSTCHKMHEYSVMWCTSCHLDVTIPDGWFTTKELDALNKAAG